eukprot:m.71683 g.71683  ORF g.71683 m.71683 type:complete len:128 (+) comp8730_c0_seq1:34-417(+)
MSFASCLLIPFTYSYPALLRCARACVHVHAQHGMVIACTLRVQYACAIDFLWSMLHMMLIPTTHLPTPTQLFPVLALSHVVTYGALTSYLIAQVFVSSDQVMQHWIAIVFGVGQTAIQLLLGVAKLD